MSLWDIQLALDERLYNYSPLMSIITDIYDGVSSNARFPYVAYGEDTKVPWSTKNRPGDEVTHTLHVWSNSTRKQEVKNIMAHIEDALQEPLQLGSGFSLVIQEVEFQQVFEDNLGSNLDTSKLQHGVMRFRFRLQK